MKFLPGDKIRVTTNGKIGTVLSVGLDPDSGSFAYKVIWEDLQEYGGIHYKLQSGERNWELFDRPNRKYDGTIGVERCAHSWKQYSGLRDSFAYCEKCNSKRAVEKNEDLGN